MDRLTQKELDAMPPKAKKDAYINRLYLENDFLTAYALHTDWRVKANPHGAVGSSLDWERHGDIQAQFLKDMGLQPHHRLLDIGCGTGRLARKIVPYLDTGHYVGADLSIDAIEHCLFLAECEDWLYQRPTFITTDCLNVAGHFDFLWSFSVFLHLPTDIMRNVMKKAADLMHAESKFYFSYIPEKVEVRTSLKQFRHKLETYQAAVRDAGMTWREVPEWPADQKVALAMLER